MELNIFKLDKVVKGLEADKLALVGQLEIAQKDLLDAQNTIGEFMVKQQTFDSTIEQNQKDYQAKLDELEVKLAEAKGSANKEAAQVLAAIGVETEEIPVEVADTKGSVSEQFSKMKGQEQAAFYQANKDQILLELGLKKI